MSCKSLPFVLGLAAILASPVTGQQTLPNILFISVDDLNDWVGVLGGHPQAKTPNLDRLASSGVLFTNAHCPGSSCNPSRTAIMTGLPPNVSGLYSNLQKMREILPRAEIIPKYFTRHGYWSAGAGKILHYFIDAPSWEDYFPEKETEDPFPKYHYPEKRPHRLPYEDWMYREADWGGFDMSDEEFGGDYAVTEWVIDQLRVERERPFFLACGIYRPHLPWFVPQKYVDMFPLDEVQLPPGIRENDLEDLPPAGVKIGRGRYLPHIREHGLWREGVQAYLAAIAYADAMVGRVLDELERSPHRDNTIVAMWSDHGWHLGEKEHWRKFTGWRVCTRVPLMIRAPEGTPGLPQGTTPGGVSSRPVNLVDLYQTLTDLAGLPSKDGVGGHSLTPLLAKPNADWPHASVTYFNKPGQYAVSTEDWRYLRYAEGGEELYDIANDPYEWENLASSGEHADKLAEMRTLGPKNEAEMRGMPSPK